MKSLEAFENPLLCYELAGNEIKGIFFTVSVFAERHGILFTVQHDAVPYDTRNALSVRSCSVSPASSIFSVSFRAILFTGILFKRMIL